MTKPMHRTGLAPELIEYMKTRRGAVHVYDDLVPARTAVVVIDMQNAWLMEGQPVYTPYGVGIVPAVNRLAAAARRAGSPVYWLRNMHSEKKREIWPVFFDFFGPGRRTKMSEALTQGHIGAELWHELDVKPGDEIVDKVHYSALIRGSSDLEDRLKGRGVDTLVIAGVATQCCCEATARDAHMMNYKVIIASDGCASSSDLLHSGALNSLYMNFADIMTVDEVAQRLERGRAEAA
jgi:ureidoacrylate peracid hydrolase